eukprot:6282469-Ditylum_brightwellii.AAC.1
MEQNKMATSDPSTIILGTVGASVQTKVLQERERDQKKEDDVNMLTKMDLWSQQQHRIGEPIFDGQHLQALLDWSTNAETSCPNHDLSSAILLALGN